MMEDDIGWLVAIMVFCVLLGCGSLYFVVAVPILDTDNLTQSQTLTVSTTMTADNCDAAQSIGDGACNAKISVLPDEYGLAAIVGVLVVIGAIFVLAMLALIGS